MQCVKCHSPRIIKFLDGFGKDRVFCKSCQESMLISDVLVAQKSIFEFSQPNPNIAKRWEYDGVGKNGSFVNTR